MKSKNKINLKSFALILIISGVFFGAYYVFAIPPVVSYNPGETLDPNCSPGDPNCTVVPPVTSGASSTPLFKSVSLSQIIAASGSVSFVGDIMPDMTGASGSISTRKIGDANNRFKDIWTDELHLGADSLYVNGKEVISDVSDVMNFSTDPDQSMIIKTSGIGNLSLKSDQGTLLLTSNDSINASAKNGLNLAVPGDNIGQNLNISNSSLNGDINLAATGNSSQVLANATQAISLTAPQINLNGTVNFSNPITLPGLSGVNTGDESSSTIRNKLGSASSANNGYLSSTDWSAFNNKLGSIVGLNISLLNNDSGFISANSTSTLTNKSGNISQWTNNVGYISTSTGLSVLNFASPNISQWSNDTGYITIGALGGYASLGGANFSGAISASNLSGTNTGDESSSTIRTKLGVASSTNSGYLSSTDWNTFNNKQPAGSYLTTSTGLTVNNFASNNISQWNNNSGYITNGNSGWTNSYGFITTSTNLTTVNFATSTISQWVNNANYITSAGAPVQSVAGRTGAVVLSNSDIITALGFTPYNSTNPNGYISTSTGLTVNNFASNNISQWNNNSGYITNSTLSGYALLTGATFSGVISASNLSGTNSGDESSSTIRTKIGNASSTNSGYLSLTDWSAFNNKLSSISGLNISTLNNDAVFITANSTSTLTNKSGNISQWTNNSNYITSAGAPVQSVAGRTGAVVLSQSDIAGLLTTSSPTFGGLTLNGKVYIGSGSDSNQDILEVKSGHSVRNPILSYSADTFTIGGEDGLTLNSAKDSIEEQAFFRSRANADAHMYAQTINTSNIASLVAMYNPNVDTLGLGSANQFMLTMNSGSGKEGKLQYQYGTGVAQDAMVVVPTSGTTNAINYINFPNASVNVGYGYNTGYKLAVNGNGYFSGQLSSGGALYANNTLYTNNLCLNGTCNTNWPTAGSDGYWTDDGYGNIINTNTNENNKVMAFGSLVVDYDGDNGGTFNNGGWDGQGLVFGADDSGEGIASNRGNLNNGNVNGLDFYTSGSKRLSINHSGKIGINVTDPDAMLQVQSPDTGTSLLSLRNDDGEVLRVSPKGELSIMPNSNTGNDPLYITDNGYNTDSNSLIRLSDSNSSNDDIRIEKSVSGGNYLNFRNYGDEQVFRVDNNGMVRVDGDGAGSSNYPAYGFVNDSDTGMYLKNEDVLSFATDGSDALVINDGDVSVNNKFYIDSTNGAQLVLNNQGSDFGGISNNNDYSWSLSHGGDKSLGANVLTWTQGDKVGIGTDDPSAKLEVSDGGQTTLRISTKSSDDNEPKLQFYSNYENQDERNWQISTGKNAMGDISFVSSNSQGGNPQTDGVTRLEITKDGYVGIGISNPSMPLQVNGNVLFGDTLSSSIYSVAPLNMVNSAGGVLKAQLNLINGGGGNGAGSAIDFYTYTDAGNGLPGARFGAIDDGNYSGSFVFSTKDNNNGFGGLNERMRVSSNGNIGINTDSPNEKLTIQSSGDDTSVFAIRTDNPDHNNIIEMGETGEDGYLKIKEANGTVHTSLSGYGDTPTYFMSNVGIGTSDAPYLLTMGIGGGFYDETTGNWVGGSDRAYKTNILDLSKYGLATVLGLRPVDYTLKKSGLEQVGFIAQEVKAIVPELVSGQDGAMGINYGGFAPLLTKAIQELNAKVDNLSLQNGRSVSLSTLNELTISGALTVDGPVNLGPDSVGEAVVKTGETKIKITFSKPYQYKPVVTLTPFDFLTGEYKVAETNLNSFTIELQQAQTIDIKFGWHSFGSKSGIRLFSDGTSELLNTSTSTSNSSTDNPVVVSSSTLAGTADLMASSTAQTVDQSTTTTTEAVSSTTPAN